MTGGCSPSSSRTFNTRNVRLPSGIVSPARQFGTAALSVGGSAGAPSTVASGSWPPPHSGDLPLGGGRRGLSLRFSGVYPRLTRVGLLHERGQPLRSRTR